MGSFREFDPRTPSWNNSVCELKAKGLDSNVRGLGFNLFAAVAGSRFSKFDILIACKGVVAVQRISLYNYLFRVIYVWENFAPVIVSKLNCL